MTHQRPEGAPVADHPLAGHPQRGRRTALQAARPHRRGAAVSRDRRHAVDGGAHRRAREVGVCVQDLQGRRRAAAVRIGLAGDERELVHGEPDDDSVRGGHATDARRQARGRLVPASSGSISRRACAATRSTTRGRRAKRRTRVRSRSASSRISWSSIATCLRSRPRSSRMRRCCSRWWAAASCTRPRRSRAEQSGRCQNAISGKSGGRPRKIWPIDSSLFSDTKPCCLSVFTSRK